MTWQQDWKKWTQATYGLIQAVHIAERLDLGNVAQLEDAIRGADAWAASSLGFVSAARRRSLRPGTVRLRPNQVDALLFLLKPATLEMLLIGTASVTEVLLSDLLVARNVCRTPPATFRSALSKLEAALTTHGPLRRHSWALTSVHEMRILRNCIVHAAGAWSARAVAEMKRVAGAAPAVGARVAISVDDLFAYRRAARTVLNAAARV